MNFRTGLCCVASALSISVISALPGAAATYNELELKGGQFSAAYQAPTEILSGFDTVTGRGSQNTADFMRFTGLRSGAQTISLTFSKFETVGAGNPSGVMVFSDYSMKWSAYNGKREGDVALDWGYLEPKTLSIFLGEDFKGPFELGLIFTHGEMAYNIFAPGNAAPSAETSLVSPTPMPAAVPLPAGIILLGSVLAGGAAIGASRRKSAASVF